MRFNWQDPLDITSEFTPQELEWQCKAREFCHTVLMPRVEDDFRVENFDRSIVQSIARAGFFAKHAAVTYGLIAREFERCDSGYRTLLSVSCSLVLGALQRFGSDQQIAHYVPLLESGELVGCFALTEPEHGSDPHRMLTTVKSQGDRLILNGTKRWIGMANIADLMIVWAKNDGGRVCGYLVDAKTAGITINVIEGKFSLRTVSSCEIHFNDVELEPEAALPQAMGIKSAFECLNGARYGIGWGALGAAEACYETARNYIMERNDFARKQLVQQKLAYMCRELTLGLQAALRVGRLMEAGKVNPEQISLIKQNSSVKALQIARMARDVLGGNGILDHYGVVRHLLNLESVVTYEGTSDIHSLILGKAIVGENAI